MAIFICFYGFLFEKDEGGGPHFHFSTFFNQNDKAL